MKTAINPSNSEDYLPFLFAGFTLDIGGEGRHPNAWNLNPSRVKTMGVGRGESIPRLILGRADAIPLPANSVELVIVERTPLTTEAYREIRRIIKGQGTIVLRHALHPKFNPHRLALQVLPGRVTQRRRSQRDDYWLQETVFLLGKGATNNQVRGLDQSGAESQGR